MTQIRRDRNPATHGLDGTEDVVSWYYARTQMRRLRGFYALALMPFLSGLLALHAEPELAGVSVDE